MRSYLSIIAVAAALTTFVTSFASWMLDPYGIRHPGAGIVTWQINDKASKIEFLAKHCREFDGYIVGNSRSQMLTGSELAANGVARFYNLATLGEDIVESLGRLEFLFKVGCPISHLVVGESIDILAHPHPDAPSYREHPWVTGENPFLFYSRYFLGPQPVITYIRSLIDPTAPSVFYHPDGHVDFLWDMTSDADFAVPNCRVPRLSPQDKDVLYSRLPKYRRLAALTEEHHVKLVVWLTPLSKARSSALDDPEVIRYLAELRQIAGITVLEADRNSPLLSDFHQWHDCSHFHRAVFDQLVAPGVTKLLRE
jgi:hypothetical protein